MRVQMNHQISFGLNDAVIVKLVPKFKDGQFDSDGGVVGFLQATNPQLCVTRYTRHLPSKSNQSSCNGYR